MTVEGRSVPVAAVWLGGFGVLPFLACAAFLLAGPPGLAEAASHAIVAYGAVILSFLGGVRWGFATKDANASSENAALLRRLTVSVVPALVAWAGLLTSAETGILLLSGAFLLVLLSDIRAARSHEAPLWYPLLRGPLTLLVVASLLAAALA